MINEHTVADIINFQFKDARQALITASQIEISGFGKFVFLPRKAEKELERLKKIQGLLQQKEVTPKIEKQLKTIAEEIAFVEFKIKEYEAFQSNNRGMAQSPNSSEAAKGEDRDGVSCEDGYLQELPT